MPETDTVGVTKRCIRCSERQALAADIARRYTGGESIRSLAASSDYSYGFVHRLLTESGVQLRPRGAAGHRKQR
jgi:Helix-turn-helix domain